MAKYVNGIKFFAYCLEELFYVKNTYIPLRKNSQGKYEVRLIDPDESGKPQFIELNPTYLLEIKKRLYELHKRDLTTAIVLFSGIKRGRYGHTFWHPNNNTGIKIDGVWHQTTADHQAFMTHRPTVEFAKLFAKSLARAIDNPKVFYLIQNEPMAFKRRGKMEKFYDEIMQALHEAGVPNERIMINFVGNLGSRVYKYLEKGNWSEIHGCNTPEVVRKFHSTEERWGMREKRIYNDKGEIVGAKRLGTIPSGDGGVMEDLGVAKGLKVYNGPEKQRKGSPFQWYKMAKFDQSHGNYYPDLNDAIRIATSGLNEDECRQLGVSFAENRYGELIALNNGFFKREIDAETTS